LGGDVVQLCTCSTNDVVHSMIAHWVI
jgi:hypothetical protein